MFDVARDDGEGHDGTLVGGGTLTSEPAPVIFVDLDGVLAPWETGELDPACVRRLERLWRSTGARLVITSSWREHTPLAAIASALFEHGLAAVELAATPVFPRETRGDEIRAWLAGREAAFVVLDDAVVERFADRQVRTDADLGLSDEDCVEAARRLALER